MLPKPVVSTEEVAYDSLFPLPGPRVDRVGLESGWIWSVVGAESLRADQVWARNGTAIEMLKRLARELLVEVSTCGILADCHSPCDAVGGLERRILNVTSGFLSMGG